MENLRYYWTIYLRRLPHFLVVASVISAASVIVAMNLPPSYVSHMKLIVESPKIPNELAASTVLTPAQEQLQIVEQRLLTRANLLDIANRVQVFDDAGEMSPDQIVTSMLARTELRKSSYRDPVALMEVSFEAPTGAKAAAVLNEYLTLIQEEDTQSRTGRATQTLEFFDQEVERLSEALAERNARILAFKTANSNALPETLDYRLGRQTFLQERLTQLERDIRGLTEQRGQLIRVYEATGQVTDPPETGKSQTSEELQLQQLRAELNEALGIYSEQSPRVRMLKARIAQVAKVVSAQPVPEPEDDVATGNSLLDVQIADIAASLKGLEEERVRVAAQLEELTATIDLTPTNAVQLDELQHDRDNIQQQYNVAVDRMSRASTGERIEVTAQGQRISVIEPPAIPNKPSKPNRVLIAGGGSFVGILAGLGLVVLLELLNRTIRRPVDLMNKLGITPLATIPYYETSGEALRRRSFKLLRLLLILIGVPLVVYVVHTYYHPLDLLAERVMDKFGVRW